MAGLGRCRSISPPAIPATAAATVSVGPLARFAARSADAPACFTDSTTPSGVCVVRARAEACRRAPFCELAVRRLAFPPPCEAPFLDAADACALVERVRFAPLDAAVFFGARDAEADFAVCARLLVLEEAAACDAVRERVAALFLPFALDRFAVAISTLPTVRPRSSHSYPPGGCSNRCMSCVDSG
jgi:hypothetical protein